jgi:hypothetical protein
MTVRDDSSLPVKLELFCYGKMWISENPVAIVTRVEFERLFENRLEAATQIAEQLNGKTLPRAFRIRLYGPGHPGGEPITTEEALAVLWLGPDRCFRIIDLAVCRADSQHTEIFARVSGHEPGALEFTWNQPPGNGPFKLLIPTGVQIADHDDPPGALT